jgi:hypothetical protein
MLTTLALMGMVAMGNVPAENFTCSDSAFTLIREGGGATLKGTLTTPHRDFTYSFKAQGAAAFVIDAHAPPAQKPTSGKIQDWRSVPAMGTVQVNESFNLPATISEVRFTVQGLSAHPQEFMCQARVQG